MLFLLGLLTAGYFAVVLWVGRSDRRARTAPQPAQLPAADLPPASAVGWPPRGAGFTAYVDEGFAALDAYLSGGFAT